MGIVQRIERKLEVTVGDVFARVFGGAIVSQEVEAALRREAADGVQTLEGGRLLAPNDYAITLSESDYQEAMADPDLTSDTFAKHLTGYISDQGWQTYGDVVVRFEQSAKLHTGQFRARATVNPDATPASRPDHALNQEPGVAPMTENPSYRGGQGQGRPGDEYYDERYGRPQDEQRGGPPDQPSYQEPGGYPNQGGYPPPGQPNYGPGGGYPDQGGYQDQGGYPNQGGYGSPGGYQDPGGYPPNYEQRPQPGGYGPPPGGGYNPPGYGQQQGYGGQPGYGGGYGDYGQPPGPPPGRQEDPGYGRGDPTQYAGGGYDQGYQQQPQSYGDYGPSDVTRYGPPPSGGYGAPPAQDYGAPPAGDYGAPPAPDYGAPPAQDYGAPPAGDYGAPPAPDYGAPPAQDYGAPPGGGYGAAQAPDYGAPPAGYGAPSPGGYEYGQGGYGGGYGQNDYGAVSPSSVTLQLDDGSGRTYQLREGANVIGRGQDAQFRLPDTGVSRRHLEIRWDGQTALLSDLNSTNGTTVNNAPVQEWQLADGDVIRLGHSEIIVRMH